MNPNLTGAIFLIVAIIAGILLIFTTSCDDANSQSGKAIIVESIESVPLLWTHSWLDILDNPECVVCFEVVLDDGDTTVIARTEYDIVNCRPDTNITIDLTSYEDLVNIVLGIRAVDKADNKSEVHWSTDPDAGFGGWFISTDIVIPSKPSGLRPQ